MSKAIVPILIGVALVVGVVATGGIGIGAVGFAAAGATATGAAAVTVGVTGTVIGGLVAAVGAATALQGVMAATTKTPKVPLSMIDRLNASMQPNTPRKAVFGGPTAMNTDIRYVEPSGENQEYIDYIICVAAHRVTSIDELWLEDTCAWTASGGVQGQYSGYLTVSTSMRRRWR